MRVCIHLVGFTCKKKHAIVYSCGLLLSPAFKKREKMEEGRGKMENILGFHLLVGDSA